MGGSIKGKDFSRSCSPVENVPRRQIHDDKHYAVIHSRAAMGCIVVLREPSSELNIHKVITGE